MPRRLGLTCAAANGNFGTEVGVPAAGQSVPVLDRAGPSMFPQKHLDFLGEWRLFSMLFWAAQRHSEL